MTEPVCRLTEIFTAQRNLMAKFHAIEAANGFRVESSIPVDLDDPHDQLRLKEFAWRVTEEIGETIVAMSHGTTSEKYREEVSDVLHFLVEMLIVAGITPNMIMQTSEGRLEKVFGMIRDIHGPDTVTEPLDSFWLYVIVALTQAMNELKNRPWKQSRKPTNQTEFRHQMVHVFYQFISACIASGLTADDLHEMYFKKNAVNQHRQASGV